MIRINLLSREGVGQEGPAAEGQQPALSQRNVVVSPVFQGFAALLFFGVVAYAVGSVWIIQRHTFDDLLIEEAQLTVELMRLKAQAKDVLDYEANKKTIQSKIATIKELRQIQRRPVHLLDEISKSLPERVWLMGLSNQSNQIDLEGRATTNDRIVEFVNRLKQSPYFYDVEVLESREQMEDGGIGGSVSVYAFKLKWLFRDVPLS